VRKTTQTGNDNVGTSFRPLNEGVIFKGKVRYHNLKKAELGALLSALSFHGTDGCFHNIGMAKSLGYGKIALTLDGLDNIEAYLKAFEVEVSEQVENWSQSEQLKELLSMATEQENSESSELKYMELEQFAKNKKAEKYLHNYTALHNIDSIVPTSLVSEEDLEELRVKQAQRKEQEILRQEQRKRDEAHTKEWEIVYASTNLSTIEAFVTKYPDSRYLDTANKKIAEINKALKEAEQKAAQKEAEEKWEAVQRVDKKYYEKALRDFMAKYGDSVFANDAKKALESLSVVSKPKSTTQKLDFSKANDGKSIERAIKTVQNPSDDDKDLLEEAIKRVYPMFNGSQTKLKKFNKSTKLMIKWLGEERFHKIIKELDG